MDRIDLFLKTVIAFVGALISWMVGGLGVAIVVLLGLMAIDFGTGLMVGIAGTGLESDKGKKGLMKKVAIILLICAVYLIQTAIPELNRLEYAGDGIALAYCVIEFISIVENVGQLGVPIGPLKNVVAVLKNKNDSNDQKGDAA